MIDNLPKLPAKFLAKQGFLKPEAIVKGFVSNGLPFVVFKKSESHLVDIVANTETANLSQVIDFLVLRQGFCGRPYFICPVTGRNTSTLYFDDLHWASREAHRLLARRPEEQRNAEIIMIRDRILGTGKRQHARGKRWEKAVEDARGHIERLGLIPNSFWALSGAIHRGLDRQFAQKGSSHRNPIHKETTLDWAIEHGALRLDVWQGSLNARDPAPNYKRVVSENSRPLLSLEEQPSIDIKALRDRRWLVPGQQIRWILAWPESMTGYVQITLILDRPSNAKLQLQFQFQRPNLVRTLHQRIELVQPSAMPGRWFFKCPLNDTQCARLYLRNGFFASANAQRLIHRTRLPLDKADATSSGGEVQ